ncbi:hypothetical protein Acsp07_37790 [Actinomycetospora sp. NBRC 106378]|nr:hypothetical protein Acsp07_37790 [Actinomycetospora sp. NBRC 106378]
MIDPSEMNMRALNPTVRRRPGPLDTGASAVVDMGLPEISRRWAGARIVLIRRRPREPVIGGRTGPNRTVR